MVGFTAPHLSNTFKEQDAGKFENVQVPRTPSWNEADVSDKPRYIRQDKKYLYNQNNAPVHAGCKDDETNAVEQNDCEWRRALSNLQTVDRFLSDALAALEASVSSTTPTCFCTRTTATTGASTAWTRASWRRTKRRRTFHLWCAAPACRKGSSPKSSSVTTTLRLRSPISPGRTSQLRGWAKLRTPARRRLVQRRALALYVERAWKQDWRTPYKGSAAYVPPYEAIRMEEALYVRYRDDPWTTPKDAGFEEYYDLADDPYQVRNHAYYDEVSQGTLREMGDRLTVLRDCAGDACWAVENGRAQTSSRK